MALCWAGLLTVYSTKAQEITATGNVISPTGWMGVTYKNAAGVSAVEGGNYWGGPVYNTDTNTIRFSFGLDTVHQTVNLESALSGIPVGLKVSGFNYRFSLMSVSGDTLQGTFTTKNTSGTAVDTTNINFSGINTNGAFTSGAADPQGTVTYGSLYSPSELSSFTASFVGKDSKFWAGLYGPRVRDFNVGFLYTGGGGGGGGDSAPTPPKVAATASPVVAANDTTTLTTPAAMADPTKNEVTSSNVGGVQVTATGEITPIVNVPRFVRSTNDIGETTKKEQPKVTSRPVVTPTPIPVPRRVDSGAEMALKLVTEGPQPVTTERTDTVIINKSPMQESQQQQARATTPVIINRRIISEYTDADQERGSDALGSLRASNQFSLTLGRSQGLQVNEIQAPQRQALMSATNPLNSYLTMVPSENAPDNKSTVKSNVQNNELAGGVDLSRMAIQPQGFADYLNLALTDATFYGPKEAYPNQRVVDNARAQRLLQGASDRMHQQMVNSQYK